jgi:hypothetical protein
MEILGYIVQYFHEDKFLPETGFKHLCKTHTEAVYSAKARFQDYAALYQYTLESPYELHTPTKKQTDEAGYSIIFRNQELQIWIEAIIK